MMMPMSFTTLHFCSSFLLIFACSGTEVPLEEKTVYFDWGAKLYQPEEFCPHTPHGQYSHWRNKGSYFPGIPSQGLLTDETTTEFRTPHKKKTAEFQSHEHSVTCSQRFQVPCIGDDQLINYPMSFREDKSCNDDLIPENLNKLSSVVFQQNPQVNAILDGTVSSHFGDMSYTKISPSFAGKTRDRKRPLKRKDSVRPWMQFNLLADFHQRKKNARETPVKPQQSDSTECLIIPDTSEQDVALASINAVLTHLQGNTLPTYNPTCLEASDLEIEEAHLKFDETIFTHPHPVEQDKMRNEILHLIELHGREQLLILESEFKNVYLSFGWQSRNSIGKSGSTKTPQERKKECRQRRAALLSEKLEKFINYSKIWYELWLRKTKINIKSCFDQLKVFDPFAVEKIFPLYMHYVHMVTSIIPKEEEPAQVGVSSELQSAYMAFLTVAKELKYPSPKSSQALRKATNSLGSKKREKNFMKISQFVWIYLEYWMETCRPTLYEITSNPKTISPSSKEFFNTIFCHSLDGLHQGYIFGQISI
ncbi:hypothetical protein PTTG_11850 [Puccinia triticina 1-1 BBBD Race 1]|uniref:CxC1-like cysteine cluster associated with KDZ transposases domain-containing protein n=1 Tax=Puccinia triticina (isolate 1-1 / race 1 (BBBD)) TaxID=630390 RepID=A0A180GKY9_PUCT1|nr:hypothetical protein PTTG_11850 [Puccinia triticina 1-1 BBBD Race 1]